jgi:hypothetical protein
MLIGNELALKSPSRRLGARATTLSDNNVKVAFGVPWEGLSELPAPCQGEKCREKSDNIP